MDFVDRSFIAQIEPNLTRLRERGDDYNFRCPFCGDSRKSETLTRGWLTWDKEGRSYGFHCYNCSRRASLLELIRHVRPSLADNYVAEKFKTSRSRRPEDDRGIRKAITAKPVFARREAMEDVVVEDVVVEAPPPPQMPLTRFPDVTSVFADEWALEYAASRLVPFDELDHVFAVADIRDVASKIEAYKETRFRKTRGILFPYYNPDGGLGYLQARTQLESLRYVTFEVQGGGKLWGRHRVKPGEHIYLFEGVLDAICIPGATASGGVDLIRAARLLREEYPQNTCSLVYDGDWTTNRQVYDQVVRAMGAGFALTLTRGPGKDVNEMLVKGGWTTDQTIDMLRECTYSGLRAKLIISKTKKPWKQEGKNEKWKPSSSTATTSSRLSLKA